MRAPAALRREPLDLRVVYSVPALARVGNVTTKLLLRLLRRSGVELIKNGRTYLVPLAEIHDKIPSLWASFLRIEALAHSSEPALEALEGLRGPHEPSRPRLRQG